ncbi:butyrophilin subfamily 3 member A3-like isoform X2 [Phyllostomus hastatus]|uniref:butyrophilin subfamily 3 member A3-like isoform X2 n=1 Tax=Phyllostomus hastatus TaxID=9423 RepID=UPI001E681376|nr:butyrophilin subfamily 3 member A3-like isoform X2 [Phyllostomus hastatus]
MEGEDAELPCHLSPEMSAETMQLIWMRPSPRQVVHTYAHGQEDTPAAEYRGRTSILREDITVGKAALRIRDVRASDRGIYLCYFQDGDIYAKAQVELKVSGPFFRSAQPWVAAFAVTLLVLLVTLAGAGSFLWRQQRKTEVLRQEKTREQRNNERLQDELRWRRFEYTPREEWPQAYAEWKTALSQPADVFLDPDTAHSALLVSEDKRSLQWAEEWQDLTENPERFQGNHCVLGCESFTSGRHFWEVEVGNRAQWCVGVCRENMERKHWVKINPESGFWVMGQHPWGDYLALTNPQTTLTCVSPPERVGVFLDCELGQVSFYNALGGSHIFTFPHTRFSGPLRPVFRIWTTEPTPLTICPAQKPVRRTLLPDPGPDPSLETPVSTGPADGNGDPQAEETSLLLAAPPGAEGLLNSKTSQREGTEDVQKGPVATFSTRL